MPDGDSISANIVSFLIWLKAYGSVGAVGPMPATDAAGGKLVHYIKKCSANPEGCKDHTWNWGYSNEDLIERFKEHLYSRHRIVAEDFVEEAIELAEFDSYIGTTAIRLRGVSGLAQGSCCKTGMA